MQNLDQLTGRIARRNPSQQAVVERLIDKLEGSPYRAELTLDQAIDEFEREHPELLRLLAQ